MLTQFAPPGLAAMPQGARPEDGAGTIWRVAHENQPS
jgi:hypothetical protein